MDGDVASRSQQNSPTQHSMQFAKPSGEVLLDLLSVLMKHRKFIARFVLICTVGAGLLAIFSPKWYKSSAVVFPAEQTSLFQGLETISSLAKNLTGAKLPGLGGSSELERYMAILKSESVLLKVIDHFDLAHVYEIERYVREKTMKELLSNTEFEITDEGGLMISVFDTDSVRSAAMANYFVEMLNEVNSRMQAQNAKGNREFIETRVEKGKAELRNAEDSLRTFQEASGMVIIPDAGSSGIEAVAEFYSTKAKKELELGVLERSLREDNPLLARTRLELDEINKRIGRIPEIGVRSIRLYRDVLIQQKIMEFLVPLYEQAKVEEQRATPSVIVLDYAKVPERKAKPKISLYVLLAGVVSTVIALFIVFTLEALEKLRAMQAGRFDQLLSTARSDWFGLRAKKRERPRDGE